MARCRFERDGETRAERIIDRELLLVEAIDERTLHCDALRLLVGKIVGERDVDRRPEMLVQRTINTFGHCVFTPQEIVQGLGELVAWAELGVKPTP